MEITVAQEQARVPVTVFHIEGSVDGASYEQLQTRAQEAVNAGTRDLLFDLSAVPYMSSAGLRALNSIYNWLNKDASPEQTREGVRAGTFKSPHFKLLNPTPRVLQVLQMAGYDMFLEIHHDRKQAVNSFG
ncbi:MAG: STAS domain-containing protein [Chloroflexi bacterium]|nr:STAS domain-containing protein [Chloroflexota bacterium]